MKHKLIIALLLAALYSSCTSDPLVNRASEQLFNYPKGFPVMDFPEGNEYTEERWELGKMLFYDKALSIDGSISCAHCHNADLAFADDHAKTDGVFNRSGVRNSPSLANVGYQPYFTREGGIPSLEMQILVPIQEHNEFGHNIIDIVDELAKDSVYQQKSRSAYNRSFDAYVLTRAIANFERSLISGNSSYDRFINYNDVYAMNADAIAGMELFFSDRTHCSSCHGGFNFTNYAFENNGLYEEYDDPGRKRLTSLEKDNARFKVPSLRNVELTAPYMHDGSLATLEDVIDHYTNGGFEHMNKSSLIKPLSLSIKEKKQLVAFLKSLTDQKFIENEKFKNE